MFEERQRQLALEELGILDSPPDERVDRVARLAREMFGVPMVSVSLLDGDRQWRKSQIGLGGDEAPREDSFCDYTVRQNETVVIEDAAATEEWGDNPFVAGDPHLRFYAGHPLRAPGGEPVGTLCVLDTEPRALTDAQRDLLRDLAFWVQTELAKDREIDHAEMLQRTMGPAQLPQPPGYAIATGSASRGQLAGDFHDVALHDGRLRLTLADAMGHGIGPAIIAAGVRGSLRTAPGRSLADAVSEADRLLEEDLGDRTMFVTAFHADLDLATGRVEYIDAGHSLAFVLRADGEWEQLRSTGLPLGMGMGLGDIREPGVTSIRPGDHLLCCSDGLLDVLDPADPFAHVARVLREGGPDAAVREALRLAQGDDATDDVTVLVVRRDA